MAAGELRAGIAVEDDEHEVEEDDAGDGGVEHRAPQNYPQIVPPRIALRRVGVELCHDELPRAAAAQSRYRSFGGSAERLRRALLRRRGASRELNPRLGRLARMYRIALQKLWNEHETLKSKHRRNVSGRLWFKHQQYVAKCGIQPWGEMGPAGKMRPGGPPNPLPGLLGP